MLHDDHLAVAARRTLGEDLLGGGDRISARRTLLSALTLAEQAGAEIEVALVERALATAALAIGDLVEARGRFERAHAVLARDARRRAAIEDDRGALARAEGDPAQAERHLRRAVALAVAASGERHPATAAARARLGRVLAEQGDRAEALALLRPALDGLAGELVRIEALHAVAVATEDAPGAEDAHAAALAAHEALAGHDHPDLAPALLALGRLADARGDDAAGLALARRAVDVLEGRVVARHPDLVAARARVAQPVAVRAAVSSRLPPRLSLP